MTKKIELLPGSLTVRPWKFTGPQKERLVFQPSFFRGELLHFGGVVSFADKLCALQRTFGVHSCVASDGWTVGATRDLAEWKCTAASLGDFLWDDVRCMSMCLKWWKWWNKGDSWLNFCHLLRGQPPSKWPQQILINLAYSCIKISKWIAILSSMSGTVPPISTNHVCHAGASCNAEAFLHCCRTGWRLGW